MHFDLSKLTLLQLQHRYWGASATLVGVLVKLKQDDPEEFRDFMRVFPFRFLGL